MESRGSISLIPRWPRIRCRLVRTCIETRVIYESFYASVRRTCERISQNRKVDSLREGGACVSLKASSLKAIADLCRCRVPVPVKNRDTDIFIGRDRSDREIRSRDRGVQARHGTRSILTRTFLKRALPSERAYVYRDSLYARD